MISPVLEQMVEWSVSLPYNKPWFNISDKSFRLPFAIFQFVKTFCFIHNIFRPQS